VATEKSLPGPGAGFAAQLAAAIAQSGGPVRVSALEAEAAGRTMFDVPGSRDNTLTVLLPADAIGRVPAQALVRILSRPADTGGDGRQYLGAVVQGPFAEPDGLRADAPIVVTTTVHGTQFMPRYHGRVQVEILGEEIDGTLVPPRFRPLPNSPVLVLSEEESSRQLGLIQENPVELGLAVGFESMAVQVPARRKTVLPRHVAVLGTTGGGKSTTVSGMIGEFARNGMATVLFDTEGEYTEIGKPSTDATMLRLLGRAGHSAHGVGPVHVRYLIGRDSTAPNDVAQTPFRLDFSSISPYAAAEIMGLSEAQEDRYFKAYDTTKLILRDVGIFPSRDNADDERRVLDLDEYSAGYPRMTLSMLLDVAQGVSARLNRTSFEPFNRVFREGDNRRRFDERVNQVETNHAISWRTLVSKLYKLSRTHVFDNPKAPPVDFVALAQPGQTTVIDLSDSDSTTINNLVIASLLRGIQEQQEVAYEAAERAGRMPTPMMIVIEEAHEFLSSERIAKMETLFEQVARIARRGRKRWLGLVFVTQLPQHLPDEVLGLVNNSIIHKITDVSVANRLKRMIGGVDDGLWTRLPNLAPGQAIVSFTSMARPLLVTIHPTPCKLRMVE
jgi:DNA helicase HerA-like ATPase